MLSNYHINYMKEQVVLKNINDFDMLMVESANIANKNFEEKVSFYSLPEDRADILEHAIAIFIEIIEFFPNSFLFDSSWNIADAVMEKELQENKNKRRTPNAEGSGFALEFAQDFNHLALKN